MATDSHITRTVMIPIVVADSDESTFSYYWKMIALPQDKVLLVHVFSAKEASKDKWRENQTKLNTVITPFKEQCEQRGVNYQIILHAGKAGEGIVDLVKKHKPDLLISGSRGLNALHRAVESSVSDYIYRRARVPVLIVSNNWNDAENINDDKKNEASRT